MEKNNIIEVKNLTKDYGHGKGIFDFSFDVQRGEVFGLIGTNGSGKTTTIRHMIGFLKAHQGNISIDGLDAWKDAAELKRKIGYVPGQIDFPDVGTGTAFLKIQADMLGLKDLSYMNELIDRFKIDITVPLRRMSKGMKQKMALVEAFMAQPDIYLLDEPSTGLDPLMRDTLIEIVLEQKAKGKTVFMSSHVFKELEDTCDTTMFIQDGHIINTVRRSEFNAHPHEAYTLRYADRQEYERYLQAEHGNLFDGGLESHIVWKGPEKNELTVNVSTRKINEFFADLSGYTISGMSGEPYSLEKYYVTMIQNDGGTKQ